MSRSEIDVESVRSTLREHGLQATAARIAVLQVLRAEHAHQTVDQIRGRVLENYPAIDPATVYRTLETLENSGLAVRVELGDRLTRWAHLEHRHHHLVCRACGETVEMEDEPFQRLAGDLEDEYGVRVDLHHIVLHGLCRACRHESAG